MAEYRVEVTRGAARELKALGPDQGPGCLPPSFVKRSSPTSGVPETHEHDGFLPPAGWALSCLYEILDREQLITVFAVGDRRDVYRGLR